MNYIESHHKCHLNNKYPMICSHINYLFNTNLSIVRDNKMDGYYLYITNLMYNRFKRRNYWYKVGDIEDRCHWYHNVFYISY